MGKRQACFSIALAPSRARPFCSLPLALQIQSPKPNSTTKPSPLTAQLPPSLAQTPLNPSGNFLPLGINSLLGVGMTFHLFGGYGVGF